jgi:putative salt-induced outer membrane protein YdiY
LAKCSLLGAGGCYTLSSEHLLQQANNIGLGLFYEVEDYTNTSTKNENNVRLNLYWAYKNKVNDNMLYTSTFYFQPDTVQFSDQQGQWQNALTLSVTSTISLNLSWDMEHDTRTPNGANDTGTRYNSVLIYNF